MKAQSELTGDRKRRAETTRPRESGVTKWIPGTKSMSDVLDNLSTKLYDLSNIGTAIESTNNVLSRMATALSTPAISTFDNEVNYRPTVQQWTVRTP